MQIRFETTVTAVILSIALGAISGEAALAVRSRNYTSSEFRTVLYSLGYNVPLVDTPLTDARTRQAIREFQRQHHLQVDGVPGAQTQDVAADIVRDLRQKLNLVMNPKPPIPTNQLYSPQVETVIRQFQKKFGLPITGQATLEVRNKLEQATKGEASNHASLYTPAQFNNVLHGLGYNVDPDSQTLTDARTQQAIRDIQQHYNLSVDGIAGSQTQDVVGNIVKNVQHNLNLVVKPAPLLPLNYIYTPETETAIRLFQQRLNLPVTGVASLEVRNKLDRAAKKIAQ
ncbi:MAG: hypothetical protein NVS2B14_04670 [Chamaesiphon sp.]